MYRVHILEAATRELTQIDKPIGHRIVERINWLSTNLENIRPEALTDDFSGLFKLRVGDYRVLYEVLHDSKQIVIHAIGHRKEIYRKQ